MRASRNTNLDNAFKYGLHNIKLLTVLEIMESNLEQPIESEQLAVWSIFLAASWNACSEHIYKFACGILRPFTADQGTAAFAAILPIRYGNRAGVRV